MSTLRRSFVSVFFATARPLCLRQVSTKAAALLSEIPPVLLEAISDKPAAVSALFSFVTDRSEKERHEAYSKSESALKEAQEKCENAIKEASEARLQALKDKTDLETKLRETTKRLKWSQDRMNIVGALELIRDKADTSQDEEEAAFRMDGALGQLYATEPFHSKFLASMKTNWFIEPVVERSFGFLYHKASNHFHGFEGVAVISQRGWNSTEQFALAALFRYYGIPFVFENVFGDTMETPFNLTDIPEKSRS